MAGHGPHPWGDAVTDHRPEVQHEPVWLARPWWVDCQCGWQSRNYYEEKTALDEHQRHVQEEASK